MAAVASAAATVTATAATSTYYTSNSQPSWSSVRQAAFNR